MSFKELSFLPLLPLIAAKSQKRQRHSAGKAGEPPPPGACLPLCFHSAILHQVRRNTCRRRDLEMKKTFFALILLSLAISSLGNEVDEYELEELAEKNDNRQPSKCVEPHKVTLKTRCGCLKTLFSGNICEEKVQIEPKNRVKLRCQNGPSDPEQYPDYMTSCCHYMERLIKKKNCPL